jgi:hypothetical protein
LLFKKKKLPLPPNYNSLTNNFYPNNMKKLAFLLVAGAMFTFVACNAPKTEGAAENADSIANAAKQAEAMVQDTNTMKTDTAAAAAAAKPAAEAKPAK